MWKFETLLWKILFQVCFLFRYQTNAWEQGQVKTELEKSSKETKDVTLVYNWCPQGWDAPLWHCGHCYTKNHCHCPFSCAKYFHQHLQPKLGHFVFKTLLICQNEPTCKSICLSGRCSAMPWTPFQCKCHLNVSSCYQSTKTWIHLPAITQLECIYSCHCINFPLPPCFSNVVMVPKTVFVDDSFAASLEEKFCRWNRCELVALSNPCKVLSTASWVVWQLGQWWILSKQGCGHSSSALDSEISQSFLWLCS